MENCELKPIVEALLFVSGDPLSVGRLSDVTGESNKDRLEKLIMELTGEYARANRGLQLVEVAGGYQITTRSEMAPWIKEMEKIKIASRLSRPGLETLAIVAYKQPITRSEIELIRGVDTAGVLRTLLERKLVKIVGRKEVAGRPIVYGSTREFLQYFGLPNLSALPTLKEFSDLLTVREEDVPVTEGSLDNQSLYNQAVCGDIPGSDRTFSEQQENITALSLTG